MPTPRGGAKRGVGGSSRENGHGLGKKRSQKFDGNGNEGRRNSSTSGLGAKCRNDEGDHDGGVGSTGDLTYPIVSAPKGNGVVVENRKRIHVGQNRVSSPPAAYTPYLSVLPPHRLIDSLAITFFLINLPSLLLGFIHIVFIVYAVSRYTSVSDRYSSFKTIIPAETFIILFFTLVPSAVRTTMTELAEPVIASSLAGSGSRGAAICATVMLVAGRVTTVVFRGLQRMRRYSPGAIGETIAWATNGLKTERQAMNVVGDELEAWVLALVRQLIAIHVVVRWSWDGLRRYITNRINQTRLEEGSGGHLLSLESGSSSHVGGANSKRRRSLQTQAVEIPSMPLWTTIANNYIVATKEAELKPPDNIETFLEENESSFHISEVTSSRVRLSARGPRHRLDHLLGDCSKLIVHVNSLSWRETAVSLQEDDDSDMESMPEDFQIVTQHLDITALVPATANEIEVFNPVHHEILFHATVVTPQKEVATTTTVAPQPTMAVRPSTPVSTLTDKVNNAEMQLNELKATQRRLRKDQRQYVTSVRSEIDSLHSRLEGPDKGEERARRGNLALKYHVRQTEDKIKSLEDEIRVTEMDISNRQEELVMSRRKWENERSALDKSRREQDSKRASFEKVIYQFHSERMAVNARKEKLTAREIKLRGELEVLETAERKKDEEVDGRSRKRREVREILVKERKISQQEQIGALEQLKHQLADIREKTIRTHYERQLLENASSSPPSAQLSPINLGTSSIATGFGVDQTSPNE